MPVRCFLGLFHKPIPALTSSFLILLPPSPWGAACQVPAVGGAVALLRKAKTTILFHIAQNFFKAHKEAPKLLRYFPTFSNSIFSFLLTVPFLDIPLKNHSQNQIFPYFYPIWLSICSLFSCLNDSLIKF